jgi:hypothetical protein
MGQMAGVTILTTPRHMIPPQLEHLAFVKAKGEVFRIDPTSAGMLTELSQDMS